jgi:hypothetical protein
MEENEMEFWKCFEINENGKENIPTAVIRGKFYMNVILIMPSLIKRMISKT